MPSDIEDEEIVLRTFYAEEIARRARRLAATDDGMLPSLADIMELLRLIGKIGRRTLDEHFPASDDVDEMEGRQNWMSAVLFVEETAMFPGFPDLSLALTELVRGQQLASISPLGKSDGRRTSHRPLRSKKYAVQAAARIAQLCTKYEERVAVLKECGTNPRTIADWEARCNEAGPQFWIEHDAFNHLTLGEAVIVLRSHLSGSSAN